MFHLPLLRNSIEMITLIQTMYQRQYSIGKMLTCICPDRFDNNQIDASSDEPELEK